jgi:hypothetical protein
MAISSSNLSEKNFDLSEVIQHAGHHDANPAHNYHHHERKHFEDRLAWHRHEHDILCWPLSKRFKFGWKDNPRKYQSTMAMYLVRLSSGFATIMVDVCDSNGHYAFSSRYDSKLRYIKGPYTLLTKNGRTKKKVQPYVAIWRDEFEEIAKIYGISL